MNNAMSMSSLETEDVEKLLAVIGDEIEACFKKFLTRPDIGIILINQVHADMIRSAVDAHHLAVPTVIEIPSKQHPYEASKDSILKRARVSIMMQGPLSSINQVHEPAGHYESAQEAQLAALLSQSVLGMLRGANEGFA
ncbi:hypothetical protein KR054_007724 [Drosophila jambulina]|nr:hypothetical protein KR054_007724 [Drosophila jambulina]